MIIIKDTEKYMKVNGIIAEYNPFHKGHQYHLKESLCLTGADYTIVVMSGNFVQRGAPALLDKHTRAEMALRCGADLVLELPTLYAVSSAEYFAIGAVTLLDKLEVVTHLSFGSEHGETESLCRIAACLSEESAEYSASIRHFLKSGLTYPESRARALAEVHALSSQDYMYSWETSAPLSGNEMLSPETLNSLLSSPNNILGTEYIRALLKRKSSVVPVTIKRLGAGYHDEFISGSDSPCSALAIRQALYKASPEETVLPMPPESEMLLRAWMREYRPVCSDDFSSVLYYKLLKEKETGYEKYLDVPAELSNRIRNQLNRFAGYENFCHLLKTKNMTYTRISRCLLHILLDLEKENMLLAKALDYIPYARVLGFRRTAKPLLSTIRKCASIPLVTKMADAEKNLSADAYRLLKQDIHAGDIFRCVAFEGSGRSVGSELSLSPVIL
ncbi:MAG: nucleotidyltransferase [Lachnospiraceae bacterium]|nr:nucleotidyltransferase [uncultured Acetatifactor sp.]MCI8287463.1 nucleotidyltransferase [Lachnospiraceae bacterium]